MAGLFLSFIVCCIVLHWRMSTGDQADLSLRLLAMRFYPSEAMSQKLMAELFLSFIVCYIVLKWRMSTRDQADLSLRLLAMRFYPSRAMSQN